MGVEERDLLGVTKQLLVLKDHQGSQPLRLCLARLSQVRPPSLLNPWVEGIPTPESINGSFNNSKRIAHFFIKKGGAG